MCHKSAFVFEALNQLSGRGGYVGCEILFNGRVKLIGRAVTTIEGKMHV
ncbi:hypothetical protein [Vibrio hibernica]|nr:hypothetical protein [Vibrio hibernica]